MNGSSNLDLPYDIYDTFYLDLLCALRKKCPYSELVWSVFSPNVGKCGPE